MVRYVLVARKHNQNIIGHILVGKKNNSEYSQKLKKNKWIEKKKYVWKYFGWREKPQNVTLEGVIWKKISNGLESNFTDQLK